MNMTILLALLPLLFAPQNAKQRQDDVIQLNESAGGGIKVGQITQVDKNGIQLRIRGRSKPVSIPWSSILPYSVYQVKVARIQKGDADSHWDLAEFCRKHTLYSFAVREYREAMKIDISALLGGDIYSKLRERREAAKERFSRERDEQKALSERKRCLSKLTKEMDVPPEVLASLPSPDEIKRRAEEAARKVSEASMAKRRRDFEGDYSEN